MPKNYCTVQKIKRREYSVNNMVTIKELKEAIYDFYGYDAYSVDERRLIFTPIKNGYNRVYSFVLSIEGTPPKGECFVKCNLSDFSEVSLIFIGGLKIKQINHIRVIGLPDYLNEIMEAKNNVEGIESRSVERMS